MRYITGVMIGKRPRANTCYYSARLLDIYRCAMIEKCGSCNLFYTYYRRRMRLCVFRWYVSTIAIAIEHIKVLFCHQNLF